MSASVILQGRMNSSKLRWGTKEFSTGALSELIVNSTTNGFTFVPQ